MKPRSSSTRRKSDLKAAMFAFPGERRFVGNRRAGPLASPSKESQGCGMTELTAIGLMSGTSMDGIDAAVLITDGEGLIRFGPTAFFAYPAEFRRRIEN